MSIADQTDRDIQFFFSHFDLLIRNQDLILGRDAYRLCDPGFSRMSYLGSAKILLGTLLIGWRDKVLIETCNQCEGEIVVFYFGGNFSFQNSKGYCRFCDQVVSVTYPKRLLQWINFLSINKRLSVNSIDIQTIINELTIL